MESHGVPGSIQVSEATFELTRAMFDFERRGTVAVKGKGDMTTYLLVRRKPPESERRAALPSERAPKTEA
jgi:class 3 adenylate cyclase